MLGLSRSSRTPLECGPPFEDVGAFVQILSLMTRPMVQYNLKSKYLRNIWTRGVPLVRSIWTERVHFYHDRPLPLGSHVLAQ